MLYPVENRYRTMKKLDGFWHFKIDEKDQGNKEGWPTGITDGILIAVPASWNDLLAQVGMKNDFGCLL